MASLIAPLASILGALPSTSDIATQLLLGAGTTVVMSGLTSTAGQNAIDPLHLIFHAPTTPATQTTPAVAQAVNTISAAAFGALPAASQAALIAAGVHII